VVDGTVAVTQDELEGLPRGDILRPGTLRDHLALTWLAETSHRTYWPGGGESLPDLLKQEPSVLWLRGDILRGAILFSLHRHPVATVRLLTLRDEREQQAFFDGVLPYAEDQVRQMGARWIGLDDGNSWLVAELSLRAYHPQDRVVYYRKGNLNTDVQGNREVTIRRAGAEDVPHLVTLDAAAFEPFWHLSAVILQRASEECPYLLVAELHQTTVGYLMAESRGHEAYVGRVAVAPAFQSQGIGARLMVEALSLMRCDGLHSVALNTQADNLPARHLYERLGFRLTGHSQVAWSKSLVPMPPH
jgi:ribosomal protein S18 acetylase RimI-like enzyme